MKRKVDTESVLKRAKNDSEHRKLYSFRLKEDLMTALKKAAEKEKLTVTALLEAMVKDYLKW